MARKSQAERHAAHRKAVEAEKRELRQAMKGGGHFYFEEWYRHHRKNGDAVVVEAMEEMWDDLARHDRANPAPPDFGMDDGREALLDEQRDRQRERDEANVRRIAEGARKKAAGIGGGLYAMTEPEPEPEDDEPDPEAEQHEGRRRALASHGLLSRTPAPPQEGRKKKRRRGYHGPPFVG